MTWEYPIQPSGQIVKRPRCEVCGSTHVKNNGSKKVAPGVEVVYYQCLECVSMLTGKPTTFKVTRL